jgi:bis(5'-nucleosyl)-tetraphosphatase (symmetrical)
MSTYAIGDVQGCFDELQHLLRLIQFNSATDTLWFTGDLINRGTQSLETLRFVKSLGEKAITVLGNHDLHFLAVVSNADRMRRKDTFQTLLAAPDCEELFQWLRHKPLIHHDASLGFTLIHAGLAPQWDLKTAMACADEVHKVLRSDQCNVFFEHMYGNNPDQWLPTLCSWERLRVITNYFTRTRYMDKEGRLDLNYKGPPARAPHGYYPWFKVTNRKSVKIKILFGHWAALQGKADTENVYALDTGCCWGNNLTALRLEDNKVFQVKCESYQRSTGSYEE